MKNFFDEIAQNQDQYEKMKFAIFCPAETPDANFENRLSIAKTDQEKFDLCLYGDRDIPGSDFLTRIEIARGLSPWHLFMVAKSSRTEAPFGVRLKYMRDHADTYDLAWSTCRENCPADELEARLSVCADEEERRGVRRMHKPEPDWDHLFAGIVLGGVTKSNIKKIMEM